MALVQTDETTRLIVSQGFKDAREWQRFLTANGKGDYHVLAYVDDFAMCDAMQISPRGRISYIELKERRVTIETYPDCLVDSNKIQGLQKLAQDSGDKVFLVALYPQSNKIALWEIREDDEYEVIELYANHKTVWEGGPRPRIQKSMVKLWMKDAKIYHHEFQRL